MSEVTVNTSVFQPIVESEGSLMTIYADVSIAANGDVYSTGLSSIIYASTNKPGSVTAVTPNATRGQIAFATGGAVANVRVKVVGYP